MTAAETWTPGPNATRPFADIFCYWDAQPPMSRIAITAVRAGWAVIPVFPSDKRPMCTLTARERNRIAPHPSNSSLCGAGHAIIKDKVAERVFKRLEADYPGLNIGIVARPSGVVVVDADVPAAVDSFRQDWATTTHDEGYLTFGSTVTTPGAKNRNGEMKHHNGGHWYFWLPPGLELPTDCQQLSGPGGYDVRWGDVYTVARPPDGLKVATSPTVTVSRSPASWSR
jgi:hypothetical protein